MPTQVTSWFCDICGCSYSSRPRADLCEKSHKNLNGWHSNLTVNEIIRGKNSEEGMQVLRPEMDRSIGSPDRGRIKPTIGDGEKVDTYRKGIGKQPFESVVIESDWPEYGQVWQSILERAQQEASCQTPITNQ